MDDKKVHESESIKDGLEKFLDQQMFGLEDVQNAKQNHARQNQTKMQPKKLQIDILNERQGQVGAGRTHSSARYEAMHEELYDDLYENDDLYDAYEASDRNSHDSIKSRRAIESRQKSVAPKRRDNKDARMYEHTGRSVTNNKKDSAKNASRKTAGKADPRKKHKGKNKKGHSKNEKKQMPKWKKVLLILLIVLVALLIWWYVMVANVYHKMNYEKSDDIVKGSLKEDGVINVLLIGNDSRENGEDGRSDAMILVSISEKTKKIYMTSLLRDMYVEIPGHDGNRLNAAYSYGGPSLLCETIEQNFDIEINRYAIVNFQAFAAMVDAVGGVDLELSSEEVQWVNAYLNEYNLLEGREITTDYLDTSISGMLHLNGPQALAYCRNRYIGTDFGRTQRQRNVLSAISKKLPLAMATNSNALIEGLFPNLTTNMKQTEVYGLSLNAAKYLGYDIEQMAIPAEGTYTNATIRKMMVLQVDFEANKKILREQVYGEGEENDF